MAQDVIKSLSVKELSRDGVMINFNARMGSIGATAGFTTNLDIGMVTCPASQTAATFVIPLSLKQGDIITAWALLGQIESAGNTITVDGSLRSLTTATADVVDTEIVAIPQLSKTADYAIATSDAASGFSHTVIAGNTYYILVTVTSAAATDLALQGAALQLSLR